MDQVMKIMRKFSLLLGILLSAKLAVAGLGAIIEIDDGGDFAMRLRVIREMGKLDNATGKEFVAQSTKLLQFKQELSKLKQQQVVELFGEKIELVENHRLPGFAFPVFESGMVFFNANQMMIKSVEPNKGHEDFYKLDNFAALKVSYGKDGETPNGSVVYFRKDDNFTSLKNWSDLRSRLTSDTNKLNHLLTWFEERRTLMAATAR